MFRFFFLLIFKNFSVFSGNVHDLFANLCKNVRLCFKFTLAHKICSIQSCEKLWRLFKMAAIFFEQRTQLSTKKEKKNIKHSIYVWMCIGICTKKKTLFSVQKKTFFLEFLLFVPSIIIAFDFLSFYSSITQFCRYNGEI